MHKKNRRLRSEDRGVIYRMSQAGKNQTEIAQAIGFSQGTVSKELSRNRGMRGYRPRQAHRKAEERKEGKRVRARALEASLLVEVESRLGHLHSPEQIAGALRKEGLGLVSHETIYAHIREDKEAGGQLYKNLRINGKRRYRRRAKAGRTKIPGRVGIEERPASVDNRTRYGDWEVDLIEGTKGSGFLLSLYERKTRINPLLPASGPATGSFNGLHGKSKFLAVKKQIPSSQPPFARLRSGHRLFQRPSRKKQIPSS